MEALNNWVALSSGTGDNGVTKVPGALIELLGNLGELAGAVAELMGLVI